MKRILALSLVLASTAAQAALPPSAESLRRLRAVSESKEVFDSFARSQWISAIQDRGDGTYEVVAGECTVIVRVEAVQTTPPQMVPPLAISVVEKNCL